MFAVVISEKGGAERREVFETSEITVGRVRGNDLVLSKGNVSKRHARLTQKDGRFVVVDQNSTNGTYVNRQRIVQATIVREGDRIYIGDFILRIEGAGPNTATAEEGAPRADLESVEHTSWAGPSPEELKSPQLPPAPRLPAPLSRVPRRASDASEPDASRVAKAESTGRQEASAIDLVRLLVDRVIEKVERRTLERDIADSVARRVDRVLSEELARVREERGISPLITEEQLLVAARAELTGLGPLEVLMRNSQATQVTAIGTRALTLVQGDRSSHSHLPFSSTDSVERVLARLCRMSDASHDGRETFLSGRLQGGLIWRAVRQRAAPDGIVLTLRRRANVECTLDDLVREGTISRAMATFLDHAVAVRANVLVTGQHPLSVARVLSALGGAASERQLLILEEHHQLVASAKLALRLDLHTASLDPQHLVQFASALPETSLVVEALAGRGLAAVLEIVVRGLDGVMAGAHSSTIEQGLNRLASNFAAALPGTALDAARHAVQSSFDLALEVCASSDGRERVRRVLELVAGPNGSIQSQEIFSFVAERTATGGSIEGTFVATGAQPQLLEELRARGVHVDGALFHRGAPPERVTA